VLPSLSLTSKLMLLNNFLQQISMSATCFPPTDPHTQLFRSTALFFFFVKPKLYIRKRQPFMTLVIRLRQSCFAFQETNVSTRLYIIFDMICMSILTGEKNLRASSVYNITGAPSSTAVPITKFNFCNWLFLYIHSGRRSYALS